MPVKEYQQLKSTLHSKILEDIDWESLNKLGEKSSREQVAQHLRNMLERDKTPLTHAERQQIVHEVLDELFGLGPWNNCLSTQPSLTFSSMGLRLSTWSGEAFSSLPASASATQPI